MADPIDVNKLDELEKRLATLYQRVDRLGQIEAENLAKAQRQANNIVNEIGRLEKEMEDLVFQSDYLYRSFQEQTAELKNQNNILNLGRSAFQKLADLSRDIGQYQKGNADINEKNFKKMESSFKAQRDETVNIVKQLGEEEDTRLAILKDFENRLRLGEKLNKFEKQRLDTLTKEQNLYEAAKNALEEGLPILEREFKASKQIADVRKDIGGLATATAGIISKYGDSLSKFLNINEAVEAVDEYNKKLIKGVLESEQVQGRLRQIEQEKINIQQRGIELANKEREIEEEIRKIKQQKLELDNLATSPVKQNLSLLIETKNVAGDTLGTFVEKENLVKNIVNSLQLEKAEQDAILGSLNAQIDLNNQLKNQQAAITSKIAEREALQAALDNTAQTQSIEERLQLEQRIGQLDSEIRNDKRIESQIINELAEKENDLNQNLLNVEEKINEKLNERIGLQTQINNLQQGQKQIRADIANEESQLAKQDEKAAEVREQAIQSINTFKNKVGALGVVVKNLGAGFLKALKDPLTIATFILDKALEANRQVVELGKSLGYGTDRANAFRENMASIARSSSNINVTTASLTKAFNELSQATGFAYEFTADQLETQIKLTEQVGLQAEEAAQIQRLGVLTGKTSEETYKSFVRGLTAARNQYKVGINFKATLAEATKVSGQLAAQLGYNPERIAKAVVAAKAFGMTLDQVAKSGESLLNWEQSIENELKAELLTGRELNLERARAAALAGDQVALAEEIAKNVGSAADFAKMNTLQQKALAEAVGMTADELANTLRKREEAIASGKSLAQITEEEAQQALERQNIQDKFNKAILKLQDIIGNLLGGPVGQLLDAFVDIVDVAMKILSIFSPVFDGISWIAKQIANIASSIEGKWVIGLTAVVLLLPKIVGGLGSVLGSVLNIGKGVLSIFKAETWQNFGKGLSSVFKKDNFTDFFKSLKDKFLEASGLSKKLKESVGETIVDKTKAAAAGTTEKIVKTGKESLEGKLKEKTTETIKGKVEDKTKEDLTKKITEKPKEIEDKTKSVEQGSDGSKFRDKMKNVAEGIKAFGDGKVILGGLVGLPASAVGLIAMIPGYLGIKLIEKVDGEKVKAALEGVANGIKTFGDTAVTGGAANLVLSSIGLIAMIPGVLGIKAIEQVDGGKFQKAAEGIAKGIEAFGKGKVAGGSLAMVLAGIGLLALAPGALAIGLVAKVVNGEKIESTLTSLGKGIQGFMSNISWSFIIKAAVAIALLGASLIPAAFAFKMFADVAWEDIAKAGVTLIGLGLAGKIIGSMAADMIKGAVAIALLGASLIPAAYALQMFADIKWEDMAKAGVALLGLGVAGAIFGALAPLMFKGALAIAALGLSLIPFAIALNIMAPALEKFTPLIEAFGNVVTKVFDGIATVVTAAADGISKIFTTLDNVDASKLLLIGPALIGIGTGLATLGAGSVIEAIGSFLGGGPVEKLQELAAAGDGLQQTATALQNVAAALTQVSSALAGIDVSKLSELEGFASEMDGGSIIGDVTNLITAPIKAVGELIGGGGGIETPNQINTSVDLTPMIEAIKEVKASVDKLYNKNTTISMDGKAVGSTLVQGSYSYA